MALSSIKKPSEGRNYFSKEIHLLKAFGVNLSGSDESLRYKIYSVLFIGATICAFPLLCAGDLFSDDFAVVSQMLAYEAPWLAGLAKAVIMFRNRLKIGKMLRKLEREPFIPNKERGGDVEESLIKICCMITNAQIFTYWFFASFSFLVPNIYSLVKRLSSNDYHDWKFPFAPLTFLNITSSPYYEIVWFYQSLSLLSIGVHFITTDLTIAAVLVHITFQFKMLQNNLQRLVENCYVKMHKDLNVPLKALSSFESSKIGESLIFWKYLKTSLKEAVDYHLAIIDVAGEMEDLFSGLLLTVSLETLGALCFLIYRFSVEYEAGATILRPLTDIFTVCFQIFFICYWGEQVIFESQQVVDAVFEAQFVGTNIRFQKGLVLIIRRSLNPIQITAGKFAPLSLSTFVWIIRAAYSACMVVTSRQRDES